MHSRNPTLDRASATDPDWIVAEMAAYIRRHAEAFESVGPGDLRRQGWTDAQIVEFGPRAISRAGGLYSIGGKSRADLTDPAETRQAMARDIADIIRDAGPDRPVLYDDILRRGWTVSQVAAHARDAHELAARQIAAAHDAS